MSNGIGINVEWGGGGRLQFLGFLPQGGGGGEAVTRQQTQVHYRCDFTGNCERWDSLLRPPCRTGAKVCLLKTAIVRMNITGQDGVLNKDTGELSGRIHVLMFCGIPITSHSNPYPTPNNPIYCYVKPLQDIRISLILQLRPTITKGLSVLIYQNT
jgi:hypothetical protein